MVTGGAAWPGLSGVLRGLPRPEAFKDFPAGAEAESHVLRADQSNTSIIYPGRFFLKLIRKLEEGESPEHEILRFFEESTSFRNVPSYAGALEYAGGAHQATWSLAVVEGLVPHEQDAWTYALAQARRYIGYLAAHRPSLGAAPGGSAGPRGAFSPPLKGTKAPAGDPVEAADGAALEFARLLGRRTAEMHLALSSAPISRPSPPSPSRASTSAPCTRACATRWAASTSSSPRPCRACRRPDATWPARSWTRGPR
jgi:maltose alpha-D-glucosyltransferase/alpha-amylase